VRRPLISAVAILIVLATPSWAATTKPTPKATTHTSVKAPAKVTSKAPTTTGAKATSSKTTTSKRTTVVRKSSYSRPAPRKHIAVTPSPSPLWPPVNFQKNKSSDSYAKILKNEELIGIASASPAITTALQPCSQYACAAVIVASENICNWWNIASTVTGIDPADSTKRKTLGTLRTLAKGTPKQSYETVILVSSEAISDGIRVENINANCMVSTSTESIPANIYTPASNS